MANTTHLRGVALKTPNLACSREFYTRLWGLTELTHPDRGKAFFAGTGPEPCVLELHEAEETGLQRVRFGLSTRDDVDAAWAELKASGVNLISRPEPLNIPGGYYGFLLEDIDENTLELSSAEPPVKDRNVEPWLPRGLSHIILNSADNERLKEFYNAHLGFQLADWYERNLILFLRCNSQHHCLALEKGDGEPLNHVAFEVGDLEGVMRGMGRLVQAGHEPLWGPGRHGPGGNAFCYFEDPDSYVVEFTSGLIEIDEEKGWTPREWKLMPENANVWGTGGRTARAIRLMAGKRQIRIPDQG